MEHKASRMNLLELDSANLVRGDENGYAVATVDLANDAVLKAAGSESGDTLDTEQTDPEAPSA